MPEPTRYEAERAAWINSKTWLDKPAAFRRVAQLTRRAREIERSKAGLDGTPAREAEIKGVFHLWTHHDDTKTSALGLVSYVIVYGIVTPVGFGVTWLVSLVAFRAAEMAAEKHRPRVWHFLVAGVLSLGVLIGRPLGWDLWAIHGLASVIETVSGGLIGSRTLSGWYAAGWISWIYVQVALGLLRAAWLVYAWGWEAPAVRKSASAQNDARDDGMRIIDGLHATATSSGPAPAQTPESVPTHPHDIEDDEEILAMAELMAIPDDIDIDDSHERKTA
ncbi:hypothetical protein [Leucobacter massiliensis]|uniref:Uncharacterized protein n=1 Tax=Leucobacter massiliensis TaxID=1686285 RepID=A0A2S9QLR0_9MICO|nr:hypothetical protein [Leucobacter massiliensis]PRI10513.1 hypothetical protein B4915_10935 [Leucobacter massiliensis]